MADLVEFFKKEKEQLLTRTKTCPCSLRNKTLEEEKGGVSCQLDSGGKPLTSDHLETVTSPLFRPRPVTQVTCRGWNPPPRSSSFQCGPDRLLRRRSPGRGDFSPGQFPLQLFNPLLQPFHRLGHGWDPGRQRSQPRPSPSSPPHAAGLLAPRGICGESPCCGFPSPQTWGSAPSAPLPDTSPPLLRVSQRATSGALLSTLRLRQKKKKKPPTSPLRQGLRVQGVPGPGS